MRLLQLIVIVVAAKVLPANAEGIDDHRVKVFYQLALTRGWSLGLQKIAHDGVGSESSRRFKLSMTAQAFRYWLLVRDGLVDEVGPYEAQIKRSFSDGLLDVSTLKNPLARNPDNSGGFGIEMYLSPEKYRALAIEFEKEFSPRTDDSREE